MLNFLLICSAKLDKDIHNASAFSVLEIRATASGAVFTTYTIRRTANRADSWQATETRADVWLATPRRVIGALTDVWHREKA
jgi:5-carboxymethyl-2-hydroxymuconate isomerase